MAGNQDAFAAGHGGAGGTPVNRDSGEVQVYDEQGRKTTAPEGSGVTINGKTLSHEEFADLARTNPKMHQQISRLRETGRAAQVRENEGATKSDLLSVAGTEELHPAIKAAVEETKASLAVAAPRRNRPANRVQGKDVAPTLPGAKFPSHAHMTHALYKNIADSLVSSKDPVLKQMGTDANTHLDAAKAKIDEGRALHAKGGGHQFPGNEAIIDSVPHLEKAHEALDNDYVRSQAALHGINAELPTPHLATLKEGANTAPVMKDPEKFGKINLGGKIVERGSTEEQRFRTNARTSGTTENKEKLRLFDKGSPRNPYAKAAPVAGTVTTEDVEATTPMGAGRKGSGPKARKQRSVSEGTLPASRVMGKASDASIRTRVSDANRIGVTPKFDATSNIDGALAKGPKKGKK